MLNFNNKFLVGGDEVSAVVLDIGTTWVKAGFAGEDSPKALFTSVCKKISILID